MKATINGVAVEGTPQEIMEYQRIQQVEAQTKTRMTQKEFDDLVEQLMTPGGIVYVGKCK